MRHLSAIIFILFTFASYASEVHWTKRYEGSHVKTGLGFTVEDGDLNLYTTANTHFSSVFQLGYVRLGIQERTDVLPNNSITELDAQIRITPYSYNGTTWVSEPFVTADLTLAFNAADHSVEIDLSDYRLPGVYKYDLQVIRMRQKTIGSTTFTAISSAPDYIYLEAGIYSERYYNLDVTSTPSVQVHLVDYSEDGSIASSSLGTSTLFTTDELYVSWNYINGAEAYDLEWTWVDNYSATGLSASLSAGSIPMTEAEFMRNSTRIRTADHYHRIPNVFSKGYLILRVRPVGRWLDATSKEKYGKWSSGTNSKTFVSHWPNTITITTEHEQGKNWQYQSTYAEAGKKKEVAQYFDGSLKNRQTVTRINSKDQSVVGEIIYDNEGRGVINVLPFPQNEPSLRYYSGTSRNAANYPYTHREFDWENPASPDCSGAAAAPLSSEHGAGRYYSAEDHLLDNDWQRYVPESKGYAFNQVEYTPDNTGRIRRQGGVGADFQIGSGHQTDYYYLQPTQEELNRLFGYKVGYNSHYKKNMVVDPNGQVSVSYLDMHGRVVATAMAGDNSTDFESLQSESDPAYHRMIYTDLMNKISPSAPDSPDDNNHLYSTGRFGAGNDGLLLNTQLGVISDGQQYNISYEVESAWYEECEDRLIYPYVYDLVLSIKDDCGEEKFSQVYPKIIGEAAIGSAVGDFESILRTLTLSQGSYTIEKRLEINESALLDYVEHYLDPEENPCLLDTAVFEVNTPADCNTTCDECASSLGSLESYLLESMHLEGDSYDAVIAANRYHTLYNACYEPCTPLTSCDVYFSMLKRDVSPGGQYAGNGTNDPVSVFSTGKWRDPAFLNGTKNYLDASGNIAYVHAYPVPGSSVPGASLGTLQHQFSDNGEEQVQVKPWQLKQEDFEAYFEASWAEALIEYHPEYKLYLYMTEICSNKEFSVESTEGKQYFSSEEFDAILRQTLDGYETAQNNVYGIDFLGNASVLTGPLYSLDPFFNQRYAVHNSVHVSLEDWKNELMTEALTIDYKATGMTMFEFAALTVLCGNTPSSCGYTIPSGWTDPAFTALPLAQKNDIFQLYKSYYLSYKGQINQLLMDLYGFAQSPGIFNGCIGPDGFSAGAIQAFSHSSKFAAMMEFTMLHLWQLTAFPGNTPDWWFTNLPLDVPYDESCLCSDYFNDKQIRITRIGALYNEGAPAETIISEGVATTDYEQWKQTGLCPLTVDMERLLNKLAVNGRLVGATSSSSIPELVPDLYAAITGGYPGPLMTILGDVNGSELHLLFNYGQPSPASCIIIPELVNGQGSLSWSNYGNTWHIFSVSQSYPVPSSTDVKMIIQAGSTLSSSQQYVVVVRSCIDLNGCQLYYATDNSDAVDCGKEKEFEQALQALLQHLASTGELTASMVDLSSNPLLTHTILADYVGTNAKWYGASSEFRGDVGGSSRNFSFSYVFSGPVLVTNLDLNRPSETLHIGFMELGSNPSVQNTSAAFRYRVDNRNTPIDFSCSCEERQAEDISIQVENLLNELFQMDDPEGLQPQALLDMTWLFDGVEQEISGYYNEFTSSAEHCITYSTHWQRQSVSTVPDAPCLTITACDPGVKKGEVIVHISGLKLDPHTQTFTAVITMSNGTMINATGTLNCIEIPDCIDCLPQAKEPISCTDAYRSYRESMLSDVFTGFSPEELNEYLMDDSTFCAGQMAYISQSYLSYLNTFNVHNVNHSFYLTIAEFGFTPLGYSDALLSAAVSAYKNSTYSNAGNPALFLPWNEYVPTIYMPAHPEICPQQLPPVDFPDTTVVFPCNQLENNIATVNMQNQLTLYLANKRTEFIRSYMEGAMGSVVERMNTTNLDKEYHYTLYYYDRAGNLIQTVPPKGVSRFEYNYTGALPAVNEAATANSKGITGASNSIVNGIRSNSPEKMVLKNPEDAYYLAPDHTYNTVYTYNSLNQLVMQVTPDGGESRFAYDRLGRLVMSQNAKQKENNRFSYTRYDALGRVAESGEMGLSGYQIGPDGRLYSGSVESQAVNAANFPNNLSTDRTEVMRSIYDELAGVQIARYAGTNLVTVNAASVFSDMYGQAYAGDHTRNRITGVLYFEELNPATPDDNYSFRTGTFYDYDVHGNVRQLLQVNKAVPVDINNQHIKLMRYEYDLISGNVLKISFQPEQQDQFIHRYQYDADNRIAIAETSKDGFVWEKDAKYFYYDHGPLARTEIGEKKVQAMDYAYTLQGWMKSVNGEQISEQTMMGGDGKALGINAQVARDVFGYSLSYYTGDYQSADTSMLNYTLGGVSNLGQGLYNGNIRSMYTALSDLNEQPLATHQTNYTYDQLNRIKSMTGYNRMLPGSQSLSGYKSTYSYDENGNLETLKRYAFGQTVAMDDFEYHYNTATNQLNWVNDKAGASLFNHADIDNSMNAGNYRYDAIGQLTGDTDEGIDTILWTVANKVKQINYTDGKQLRFEYNGMGNRVAKHLTQGTVTTSTVYTLDVQGNAMSMYNFDNTNTTVSLRERNIYGASRLGQEQLNMQMGSGTYVYAGLLANEIGDKRYELSNHLGNVLQVVSDSKLPGSTGNYYEADVKSYSDYYPFGMQMPGRHGSEGEYRYGFNGMEFDNEVKGNGNSYTTEYRQYDSRLGRWLSLDPLMSNFPWQSPYVSFDNNPIIKVDKDGQAAETKIVEKSGKIVADIQDGSDQVFVIDENQRKNVLKDLSRRFGNNELILDKDENHKVGLKYGETLEKYKSFNDKLYSNDEQIFFNYGYSYQYEKNSSWIYDPPQIGVLRFLEDFKNYAIIFDFGRVNARQDISKGYMNRINPKIKSDVPILKVINSNEITIYINGKESTLMELYDYTQKYDDGGLYFYRKHIQK